ncbi:glycyl-tRNA synthetase subunit beta [Klebsiella pneumoniae]|uniref:Glycine--tRNA ligase beta subunit n=1 Tax=Klebsiella pneumoniae TaxID=573 RepID=A0A377UTN3_KLEPN|nr:glycyl-tRNA synthetase subunit beta [Klebsiella pneumoniae]
MTLLLGDKVIPATILGIPSDRVIRGHRFMGEPEFTIDHADQYPQILLERGKVIADYEQRKAKIKADAQEAARKIGGQADLSESLLEEVTSLVEWPVVLTAKFEEKFLAVPSEALVYTMKGDQKYFPVYDNAGKLLPNFIFVANIESKDPQQIISGNEKVVRPRLADAEFSSIPTVKNVWKITCRVWKPCCSNSNLGLCATRPIASRRWRAGLPNRLALT